MKKIVLAIMFCLISFMAFPKDGLAITEYDAVNISTNFEENINLEKIDSIIVYFEDATSLEHDYVLEKENDFKLTLTEIPVGEFAFRYGVVRNDKTGDDVAGYYKVLAETNIDTASNTVTALVTVALQNNKIQNTEKINAEEMDNIMGDPDDTQTIKDEEDDTIIVEDDEDTTEKVDEESTTKIREDDKEDEEAREVEKEKNRKKNRLISLIMFSLIGITVLVLLLYAFIKISLANK